MGTVLSLSPAASSGKGGGGGGLLADKAPGRLPGKGESRLKRPGVLISALTWKRLVAASAKKKKSTKKVTPKPGGGPPPGAQPDPLVVQRNRENLRKSLGGPSFLLGRVTRALGGRVPGVRAGAAPQRWAASVLHPPPLGGRRRSGAFIRRCPGFGALSAAESSEKGGGNSSCHETHCSLKTRQGILH